MLPFWLFGLRLSNAAMKKNSELPLQRTGMKHYAPTCPPKESLGWRERLERISLSLWSSDGVGEAGLKHYLNHITKMSLQ
jgi:hypothetical protein